MSNLPAGWDAPAQDQPRPSTPLEVAEAFAALTTRAGEVTHDIKLGFPGGIDELKAVWQEVRIASHGLIDASRLPYLRAVQSLTLKCSRCDTVMSSWLQHAGKTGRCSHCKASVQVPDRPPEVEVHEAAVAAREAAERWVRCLLLSPPDHHGAEAALEAVRNHIFSIAYADDVFGAAPASGPPRPKARAERKVTLEADCGRWKVAVGDEIGQPLVRCRSEAGVSDSELRVKWGADPLSLQSRWLLALCLRSQGESVDLPDFKDWSRVVAALRARGVEVDDDAGGPRLASRVEFGEQATKLAGMLAKRR